MSETTTELSHEQIEELARQCADFDFTLTIEKADGPDTWQIVAKDERVERLAIALELPLVTHYFGRVNTAAYAISRALEFVDEYSVPESVVPFIGRLTQALALQLPTTENDVVVGGYQFRSWWR